MKHCVPLNKSTSTSAAPEFKGKFTSLAGLLVLILPKCPACIVSYSSAITICGSDTLVTYTSHETDIKLYIALVLGLLIIASVGYALRHGRPVHLALSMALSGQILLGISLLLDENMTCYYAGATLLLVATLFFGGSYHWKKLQSTVRGMEKSSLFMLRNS